MSSELSCHDKVIVEAISAFNQGYVPIPIRMGEKRPIGGGWTSTKYENVAEVRTHFEKAAKENGGIGLGLLLGNYGNGLVDVDLDHPLALVLRDKFLPPTAMESGTTVKSRSHLWYQIEGEVATTKQYKLPTTSESSSQMIIEMRSTGGQTLIPPSKHPSGADYIWSREPWGGAEGARVISSRKLGVQVALVAFMATILENWPKKGARHSAYLALAGGLLRYAEGEVHPLWEIYLKMVIETIAEVTGDRDGVATRLSETIPSTIGKIKRREKVTGFPSLAKIIGKEYSDSVIRLACEIESIAGCSPRQMTASGDLIVQDPTVSPISENNGENTANNSSLVVEDSGEESEEDFDENSDPLEERSSTWDAVDIFPYLSGEIELPEPSVLTREDGKSLFYPGRLNSIFGKSESAKSWIALYAGVQEMAKGERIVYIDLEDEPIGTLHRLRLLQVPSDTIMRQFKYIHPEEPLSDMQKSRHSGPPTEKGLFAHSTFNSLLESFDPTLIIVDGMTALYGLHDCDTNSSSETDIIISWLKSLRRRGRSTVIIIDHTGKSGGVGASPIGSQHKIAMVQGSSIRADVIDRPKLGAVGIIQLVIFKDRHGMLRAVSSNDEEAIAAKILMDSTGITETRMRIIPPDDAGESLVIPEKLSNRLELESLVRELAEEVLRLYTSQKAETLTTSQVVKALGQSSKKAIASAWNQLEKSGNIVVEGTAKRKIYRVKIDAEGVEHV